MTNSGRLLVVSHVVHYEWEGQIWSYTPYVAELALWAELFDHVTVASPARQGPPAADCSAVPARNIEMAPMAETGGPGLVAKLRQAILAPVMCVQLLMLMRQADVVHVRCPGNLGLLGVLVAPLSRRHRIAKYAGQWSGYPTEARTYRLQRQVLRSSWWGAPVTVYGRLESDPPHVIGFFTSAISAKQIERGAHAAARREWKPPLRVLFVGRLTVARSADVVVEGVARAAEAGVDIRLQIVGDGPESDRLREQAGRSGQAELITFSGALPFEDVLSAYESSDVLVLVSQTEGFGKAASEAMAFGLVVIGSDSGYLQTILADDRGILVRPGDPSAVGGALQDIASRPEHYRLVGKRAAEWAGPYSLEGLQDGIAKIMREAWGYTRPDDRARDVITAR